MVESCDGKRWLHMQETLVIMKRQLRLLCLSHETIYGGEVLQYEYKYVKRDAVFVH